MKYRRITALFLVTVMALALPACGKKRSDSSDGTADPGVSSIPVDSPEYPVGPTDETALPTTLIIPDSSSSSLYNTDDPATSVQDPDNTTGTDPAEPAASTEETVDTPETEGYGNIPPEAELYIFADAATRYFDSYDEIPLTAYEAEPFWYSMKTLCVCNMDTLGGSYDADNGEVFYSDDQIDDFGRIMFFDYNEAPKIPEEYGIRQADGGYYFTCDGGDFTPAELISTEQDGESVVMTLRIAGGNPDDGSDLYVHVRLFEADNPFGLAVSNVWIGSEG